MFVIVLFTWGLSSSNVWPVSGWLYMTVLFGCSNVDLSIFGLAFRACLIDSVRTSSVSVSYKCLIPDGLWVLNFNLLRSGLLSSFLVNLTDWKIKSTWVRHVCCKIKVSWTFFFNFWNYFYYINQWNIWINIMQVTSLSNGDPTSFMNFERNQNTVFGIAFGHRKYSSS